jgi:hypothetical protein
LDLSAAWFNPRTGERTPVVVEKSLTFQAPDTQDWVLVCDDKK